MDVSMLIGVDVDVGVGCFVVFKPGVGWVLNK